MRRVTEGAAPEETVGQRIRRLRLARGLSQRQIAASGVTYAYISRIENGGRKPSLKALRTIARKLDVDPEYLETGNPVSAGDDRELRLRDAELELRLGGDLDRVEELLRGLLTEPLGEHLESRVRGTLGVLLARRGDNEKALRQLEAVTSSKAVRPETRPDVFETLATVYVATRREQLAIDLLERCIAAVDEDERFLTQRVRFRSFLASTFSSIGALDRARALLDEAMSLAERLARPQDRSALYWTGARIEWMESQYADPARHALAIALTAAGDVDAADAEYDRAVSVLAEREQWREAITVARDWADALRTAGHGERAYAVLEQATEFGQRVNTTRAPSDPRPRR